MIIIYLYFFSFIIKFQYQKEQMNRQKYSRQRSPPRNTLQLQEQHYRLKELLRSDLSMLQQQNAILKLKCKKVSQLQQKVQLVLKQNQHLLTENEKMSRYLHQQKSQNELIRNKCQSMNNQKMNIVGDFQHQRKKMMRQMQLLGDRLVQEQTLKKQQINQMRSQFQLELQSIKRQMKASQDSYEGQMRKLREQLDKREYQLSQYANKLKRISNDADYEILRLKEEKEKLKNELIYCEEDRIKEMELLKSKFQNNFLEEIQAIKRSHLNNLQEMQMQNDRIKMSLDDQHEETQGLITQLNKQKNYYQDTISYLKRDIQGYKHKLSQNQQLSSFQLTQLKQKLTYIHASQVQQIRNKQMMQLSSMQQQIVRCQKLINNKNIEIEQLIKDKMTNRNLFDSQMMRMKDQNNGLVFKLKDLQNKVNQMDIQLNNKINDRQKHIAYLQNVNKDLKNGYQNQSQAFQKIIQTLKQELETQKMLFRQHQQAYKQQISTLKIQLSQLKTIFSSKESQLLRKIEQLKNELSLSSDQLLSKIQSLNNKNRMIQKQNQGLKNNLILKDKQIKNLLQRIKTGGERQKKLQGQIDDLRNKIIKRQQKSNDSMSDQKSRLENSFNFQVQNMKADFEAALKLQANKYKDLQQRLRRKQFQLQQLLRMYKKMTDEIQVLTQQQANKKDITLKYPGATADLIATKNLFDVYLKTKVLDICGGALRQSNKLAKN